MLTDIEDFALRIFLKILQTERKKRRKTERGVAVAQAHTGQEGEVPELRYISLGAADSPVRRSLQREAGVRIKTLSLFAVLLSDSTHKALHSSVHSTLQPFVCFLQISRSLVLFLWQQQLTTLKQPFPLWNFMVFCLVSLKKGKKSISQNPGFLTKGKKILSLKFQRHYLQKLVTVSELVFTKVKQHSQLLCEFLNSFLA